MVLVAPLKRWALSTGSSRLGSGKACPRCVPPAQQQRPRRLTLPLARRHWRRGHPGRTEGGAGHEASADELRGRYAFPATSAPQRQLLAEAEAVLAEELPTERARRYRAAHSGGRLDLRRVVRAAGRSGGDVERLRWRDRPRRPRRVPVLVDVSGSLRQTSADALRFAHALARTAPWCEIYTFGTPPDASYAAVANARCRRGVGRARGCGARRQRRYTHRERARRVPRRSATRRYRGATLLCSLFRTAWSVATRGRWRLPWDASAGFRTESCGGHRWRATPATSLSRAAWRRWLATWTRSSVFVTSPPRSRRYGGSVRWRLVRAGWQPVAGQRPTPTEGGDDEDGNAQPGGARGGRRRRQPPPHLADGGPAVAQWADGPEDLWAIRGIAP